MMSAMCVKPAPAECCVKTRQPMPLHSQSSPRWGCMDSYFKISHENSNRNFQWNLTTILERSIALCLPNSGPDETQTNWMKLRPVRSFMEIRIFDSVNRKILFFPIYRSPARHRNREAISMPPGASIITWVSKHLKLITRTYNQTWFRNRQTVCHMICFLLQCFTPLHVAGYPRR